MGNKKNNRRGGKNLDDDAGFTENVAQPVNEGKGKRKNKKQKNHQGFSTGAFGAFGSGGENDSSCQSPELHVEEEGNDFDGVQTCRQQSEEQYATAADEFSNVDHDEFHNTEDNNFGSGGSWSKKTGEATWGNAPFQSSGFGSSQRSVNNFNDNEPAFGFQNSRSRAGSQSSMKSRRSSVQDQDADRQNDNFGRFSRPGSCASVNRSRAPSFCGDGDSAPRFDNGFDNNNDRNSVHGSNASVARSRRSSFVDEPIDEAVEFFVEESNGFDGGFDQGGFDQGGFDQGGFNAEFNNDGAFGFQDGGNGFGSRQSVNDNQAFGSSSGFGAGAGFGGSQRFPSSHSIARSHASVAQSVGGQRSNFGGSRNSFHSASQRSIGDELGHQDDDNARQGSFAGSHRSVSNQSIGRSRASLAQSAGGQQSVAGSRRSLAPSHHDIEEEIGYQNEEELMDNHASRSRQPSFAGSQRSVSNHSVAKSRTSRSPSVERQGFGGSHRSFGASHQDIGDELGYQNEDETVVDSGFGHTSRSRQHSFAGSQRTASNHSVAKSRNSRSPSERQSFAGSRRSFGASNQDIGEELGYQNEDETVIDNGFGHTSRSRQPSFAGSQRSASNHSVAKSRNSRSPSVERQSFAGSRKSFGASRQDIGDELGYQNEDETVIDNGFDQAPRSRQPSFAGSHRSASNQSIARSRASLAPSAAERQSIAGSHKSLARSHQDIGDEFGYQNEEPFNNDFTDHAARSRQPSFAGSHRSASNQSLAKSHASRAQSQRSIAQSSHRDIGEEIEYQNVDNGGFRSREPSFAGSQHFGSRQSVGRSHASLAQPFGGEERSFAGSQKSFAHSSKHSDIGDEIGYQNDEPNFSNDHREPSLAGSQHFGSNRSVAKSNASLAQSVGGQQQSFAGSRKSLAQSRQSIGDEIGYQNDDPANDNSQNVWNRSREPSFAGSQNFGSNRSVAKSHASLADNQNPSFAGSHKSLVRSSQQSIDVEPAFEKVNVPTLTVTNEDGKRSRQPSFQEIHRQSNASLSKSQRSISDQRHVEVSEMRSSVSSRHSVNDVTVVQTRSRQQSTSEMEFGHPRRSGSIVSFKDQDMLNIPHNSGSDRWKGSRHSVRSRIPSFVDIPENQQSVLGDGSGDGAESRAFLGSTRSVRSTRSSFNKVEETSEHADGFDEQINIRSMGNEKYTNHRLSKLSINTNADEFVLVGGHPLEDGRASCPAGRNTTGRHRQSLLKSTDFLNDRYEGGFNDAKSTNGYSRQSLKSTAEENDAERHISQNSEVHQQDAQYDNNEVFIPTASEEPPQPAARSASTLSVNIPTQEESKETTDRKNSISGGSRTCSSNKLHHASSKSRDFGDDTEENLLLADRNSRIESHLDIPVARSRVTSISSNNGDNVQFCAMPELYSHPDDKYVDANGQPFRPTSECQKTPSALTRSRYVSKSAYDVYNNRDNNNNNKTDANEVPRPLVYTDAITPQSSRPCRSRMRNDQSNHSKDKSEIAIQTGETIRLRQVADFSAIATSMDIGGSGDHVDYKKPSEDNYSSARAHPTATILSNFLQQRNSFNQSNQASSDHHVTAIHRDISNQEDRHYVVEKTIRLDENENVVGGESNRRWNNYVEVVPKKMCDDIRKEVLAESRKPLTPNRSKLAMRFNYDAPTVVEPEVSHYSNIRPRSPSVTKDEPNKSQGSEHSSYRWQVNDPKNSSLNSSKPADAKWNDNRDRIPGATVRENVPKGNIKSLASFFNTLQDKATEEEAVITPRVEKDSFSNGRLRELNAFSYHKSNVNSEQPYESRTIKIDRQPPPSVRDRDWYYPNELDDALLDIDDDCESDIGRRRTSTPLHDAPDSAAEMAARFQRIPSIRAEDPTSLRMSRTSERGSVRAAAASLNNSRRDKRSSSVIDSRNAEATYAQINKSASKRQLGDEFYVQERKESRSHSTEPVRYTRKVENDYDGYAEIDIEPKPRHTGLSRRSSRASEVGTYCSTQKSNRFNDIVEEETVNDHIDGLFGFVEEHSRSNQTELPSRSRPSLTYSLSGYRALQRTNRYPPDDIRFSPAAAPPVTDLTAYGTINKRASMISSSSVDSKNKFAGRPAVLVTSTPRNSPKGKGHREVLEESYVSTISEDSHNGDRRAEFDRMHEKLSKQIESCRDQIDYAHRSLLKARKEKKPLQELSAQRVILIASQRLVLLRRELQNLPVLAQVRRKIPPLSHDLKGSMVISNITLYLNREIGQRYGDSNSSFAFVVLLKSGCELEATAPVKILSHHIHSSKLLFPEKISFSNLPIDFTVELEVYVMVLPQHKVDENCAATIANKCKNLLVPTRRPQRASNGLPIGQFVRCGYIRLSRETTDRSTFYLDDAQYPLEGTISVISRCSSLPPTIDVSCRGFLTMYQSVSGIGTWERYWAVLRCGSIYFWKYPDEESTGKTPNAHLPLQSCTKDMVVPCQLEELGRPHTFSIELLVSTAPSVMNKKRIVLAADSHVWMNDWLDAINETLNVIRDF